MRDPDLVESEEFLPREEFESLDDGERAAYLAAFLAALRVVLEAASASRQLDFIGHYLDICEWTMPPEEYERLVRSRLWDMLWEHGEKFLSVVTEALASDESSLEERAWAARNIDRVRAVVEHRLTLEELPES